MKGKTNKSELIIRGGEGNSSLLEENLTFCVWYLEQISVISAERLGWLACGASVWTQYTILHNAIE